MDDANRQLQECNKLLASLNINLNKVMNNFNTLKETIQL